LTLCGVAVGIAAFVTLVGFSKSFEHEWARLYESSGVDIAVVQKTFLNTSVDEAAGPVLRALPEVARAEPVLFNLMELTPEVNAIVYAYPDDSFEMDPLVMLQGRKFRGDAPEVMLGEILAENLGKKAGDRMEIQGASFQVVGVFRGGSAFETGGALMPLRQMQRLTDVGEKVTAFHVRLRPCPAAISAEDCIRIARARIEAALPGLKAVAAAERAQNNQLVVLARATAWGTSLIALFIGALGIANTMAMAVFERTREIGIFRALGWKRRRIMRLILTESAILGLVGGVLGLLGGWAALSILAALPRTASIAIPTLNAVENVEIPMYERKLSARQRRTKALALLIEMGLEHRLQQFPGKLSAGERQRVAIARSLANDPEILLADEPTGNLDSENSARIMAILAGIQAQRNMTLIVVTHEEEIARGAGRKVRIRDGRI
jgi:putative ABC transport system permease protein